MVRTAIKQGLPPIKAIQYCTINTAQMLEKARWIGSISPSKAADILIVSDLAEMNIDQVYSDGVLVADHGKLTVTIPPYDYPDWAVNSVHLDKLTPADFRISSEGLKKANVRVIECAPNSLEARECVFEMEAVNGELVWDPEWDLAKIFTFYRHEPRPGVPKGPAYGFIKGVRLNKHCAYASTVAHDCHNLLVIGTDDEAMAKAANALIECGGGISVVVDNEVAACMPLPLAGLMSLESAEVAAAQISRVEAALEEAGCPYPGFEMTLSFLELIVLEELHLSNRGLVRLKDGKPAELVPLIVRDKAEKAKAGDEPAFVFVRCFQRISSFVGNPVPGRIPASRRS